METNGADIIADIVFYDKIYMLSSTHNLYILEHGQYRFQPFAEDVLYISQNGRQNTILYLTSKGMVHIGTRQLDIRVPQGVRVISYMYDTGYFLLTMDNQLYLMNFKGDVELLADRITHFCDLDYDMIIYGTDKTPNVVRSSKANYMLMLKSPVVSACYGRSGQFAVLSANGDVRHHVDPYGKVNKSYHCPTARELRIILEEGRRMELVHQDGGITLLGI